jgi:hypothetical protein
MALGLYAGASASSVTLLPSPTEVKPSHEIIWSEDTGRAQAGVNRAKMIGSVVDEKMSYSCQWGILSQTEFNTIKSKLAPGFFYFAVATTLASAKAQAQPYYRSEITCDLLPIGNTIYYKDVSVSVIQQ